MNNEVLEKLLHPELFQQIPLFGKATAQMLNKRAREVSAEGQGLANRPPLSVAIRTLNEERSLEMLFEDIHEQIFDERPELIVIDNESTDRSRQVARYFGAEVISLARNDFTYPKSMNLAMQAASNDKVFLTVGHALLSNTETFNGGIRHFEKSHTAGTFARVLPAHNASRTERLISTGNFMFLEKPSLVKKAGLGVLAATGAMISKTAWEDLGGFDEAYETGGEDTALAKKMIESGYDVIEEPTLSVHHSHGVGPVNYARQFKRWMQSLRGSHQLDIEKLARSRPDLDFN